MARTLTNERVTAAEVWLSDERGADLGVVPRAEALALARDRGCDLVQDDYSSSPPRCRLVSKAAGRARDGAEHRRGGEPKEIRVSTTMGTHDVETRARQAAGLLAKGYSVKLSARLAKAERAKPTAARALLEGLARDLSDAGYIECKPFNESGALSVVLASRDD